MKNFRDWSKVDTSHEFTAEQMILETIAFILFVICAVLLFLLVSQQ